MKILLADDHHLVREAIANYLRRIAGDICCVEAAELQDAREKLAAEPGFDLIILDYRMPGMNGLSGLDEVRRLAPGVPVAILSGNMDAEEMARALSRGAAGVLMKDLRGTALLEAVRLIAAGEVYVPSAVLGVITGRQRREPPGTRRHRFADKLTRREFDCIELLVRGSTNREIGSELDISEMTVKLHLNSVFKKLGARNRSDAVRIAMLQGIGGL